MKLEEIVKELFDYIVAFRRRVGRSSMPTCNTLKHELETIFSNMEAKANQHSELSSEYQQVKYPLVALADEIILTSSWNDAKKWEQHLLERTYFSTNIAGNRFFALLEHAERMSPDVLLIFYYCLAFGFKGGFAVNDPSLLRLRSRLFERLAADGRTIEGRILPDAYHIVVGDTKTLKRLWKWWHIIIAALLFSSVLFLLETLVVWPLVLKNVVNSTGTEADGHAHDEVTNLPSETNASADDPRVADSTETNKIGYTVQLGQFHEENMALEFSSKLKEHEIETRVVRSQDKNSDGRYVVLAGKFPDITSASRYLMQVKEKTSLPRATNILELAGVRGDCVSGCN